MGYVGMLTVAGGVAGKEVIGSLGGCGEVSGAARGMRQWGISHQIEIGRYLGKQDTLPAV